MKRRKGAETAHAVQSNMMDKKPAMPDKLDRGRTETQKELLVEVQRLRARLEAAEETLRAIRQGEVDALFVSTARGDQIFTLKGADHDYKVLVETMNEGAAVLIPGGIVTYCNHRFAQILKSSVGKVIGSSMHSFIPPEYGGIFKTMFHEGLRRDRSGEISLRAKDGKMVPVYLSINSLKMGAVTAAGIVVTDLTEKKEAERLREELAHVARVATMGELTASLAHELSQPLTAILSNAQAAQRYLAEDPPHLDEVRNILDDIVQDDRRAGEVIQRLRVLLKKGPARRDRLDINEVVREVLRLLHSDALLKNWTIVTELAPDLPRVEGDRIQLQQVILNLILNGTEAMIHGDSDHRNLIIRTEKFKGKVVKVTVRDFGVGLDKENLHRLFEPFYTTKPGGMGMGLSISRSIIEAHGGVLEAANNDDGGASFYFHLPVIPGASHDRSTFDGVCGR